MTDADLQVEPGDNQEPDALDWVPEKFRANPEKFTEAYTNLERELTSRSTREKELQQQVEFYEGQLAQAQQPQRPAYDPSADPLITGYEQAMEVGDFRTALAYQAQIMSQVADNTIQKSLPQVQEQYKSTAEAQAALVADHAWNNLRSRYGDDLEASRDRIAETIQAQPWLIPDAAQRDPSVAAAAIENVYKIVNPGAFVQGQPVDTTAAKLAAQGLPGAAGRPPSPDAQKAEWAEIVAASKKEPGRYY